MPIRRLSRRPQIRELMPTLALYALDSQREVQRRGVPSSALAAFELHLVQKLGQVHLRGIEPIRTDLFEPFDSEAHAGFLRSQTWATG